MAAKFMEWKQVLAFGGMAMLGGVLASFGVSTATRTWHSMQGPIVEYVGATTAEPAIVPHGLGFYASLSYFKSADCPGQWAYYVQWAGDDGWQLLRNGPAGSNPVGSYTMRHLIVVPIDAPPGPALWREVLSMECPDGRQTVSRSPVVAFSVAARAMH